MFDGNLMELAQQAAHEVLIWIGFGTLVGLCAKGIMPGRDPGGTVATVLMGIGGSIIGCGTLLFFVEGRVTPISPVGFAAATGGAFLLLFFYRLLSGGFITESEDGERIIHRRTRARRRRDLVENR
jgi:uncharacterized membrane protein YeaQ/YmgE (transglycosylase-associated protein family)